MARDMFDQIDRRLSRLLSDDGMQGVNALAKSLDLSPPTVRSRMKSLIDRNMIRVNAAVNVSERPELISAIIGINAQGQGKLNEIAKRLSEVPFVTCVSIVTGRYDIIAEVLLEGDMEDLYRVTSEMLPAIAAPGIIRSSETFVVMKSHNKYLGLPKGVWDNDTDGALPLPDRAMNDGGPNPIPSAGNVPRKTEIGRE